MRKLTILLCLASLLVAGLAYGQLRGAYTWQFDKIFYDFKMPHSDSYGIHGVAVAPDGNVWVALHGAQLHGDEPIIDAEGDTLGLYIPVYILDPNTGEHVSFSPLKVLKFADGHLDTLHTESPINGAGKGISVDKDGNILYSSWTTVYRINYQTGEGMNVFTPTDMSSITEAVQDENGNIYVGYVLGAARPVYILDNDFNLIGNAIDVLGHITRSLAVTPDGKDLYIGTTWNGFGIQHWHSEIPGVLQFECVDTLGNWHNVYVAEEDTTYEEVKLWSSCLDWDPDGRLVAGNLRPDWSGPKGSMYYFFDVSTGKIVDSVGVAMGDSSKGGLYSPRGAAWSNDGNTMYLGDFDYNLVGQWVKAPVGVAVVHNNAPIEFRLHQNYPNPFNPSTTIAFTLMESGRVELKVFDINGREVKTILNQKMNTGFHQVKFDAAGMSSGVYYYTLNHNNQLQSKQMVLVK